MGSFSERLSRTIIVLGFALCVAMIAGCGGWNVPPDAKTWKNPVPSNPEMIAKARTVYADACAKCHGVNGDGKLPPGATYIYSTKPTNFTEAKIMDAMSDGEIFWKITHGRRPMPSFKTRLTDEQRWALVDLIRTFAHQKPSGD